MIKRIFILFIGCFLIVKCSIAQKKAKSFQDFKESISNSSNATSTDDDNILVSGKAMNLFIQRKVSTYLTGSNEISISKLYATYTSESDKLLFGFNVAKLRKEDQRLVSLFNPLIETDIKENFATLYKKSKWQSDIRFGFKYSYFLPFSTINFYGLEHSKNQKSKMIRKRSEVVESIIEKIEKEEQAYSKANKELIKTKSDLMAKYEKERNSLQFNQSPEAKKRIKELDAILQSITSLVSKDPVNFDEKLEEYENELAKAEVDALYEEDAYTWSQTSWISLWGFMPLTERTSYIAISNAESFKEKKFKPWELNAQFNYLREGKLGVILAAPGFKVFQNNTALADLMTSVDYDQYLHFPGTDTANSAILETNKAFIGEYKEFVTSNINAQLVFSLSDKKKKGGERFLTPGLSIRFEKNLGEFSAVSWKLGLPLRFKGKDKDKAVNVEPQLKLNNTNNYSNKVDYKVEPIFGVNIGLPFVALFKE